VQSLSQGARQLLLLEVLATVTLAITSLILVKDEIQHKGCFPSNNLKESYSKAKSSLWPPILVTQTHTIHLSLSRQEKGGLNEIAFRFVCMKYLETINDLTKSNKSKK